MEQKGYQQYKERSVDTMTQGELLLLLYDELVKRLTRAGLELDKEQFEPFEASVDRSIAIINYLDETLDRQYEVSDGLARLYEYFLYQLGRVKIGRNKTVLTQVRTMVGELRDSFRTAQQSGETGR